MATALSFMPRRNLSNTNFLQKAYHGLRNTTQHFSTTEEADKRQSHQKKYKTATQKKWYYKDDLFIV